MCFRSGFSRLLLCAAATLLFALPGHAQVEKYEGRLIREIRFEPVVQPLRPTELAAFTQALKAGAPLRAEDVRATIQSLFSSGRYEDLAVDATLQGEEVVLTILTTIEHFIRNVQVEGVPDPPNQGQLINSTKLELGRAFSDALIRQATEGLLEVLRLNGFYQAKVDAETSFIPEAQQVDIRFIVTPGDRAKYSQPTVSGDYTKSVKDIVRTARWRKYWGFGGFKEVSDTRTGQGIDRIRRSLQKRDYLMAKVTLEQMEYKPDVNRVVPHLRIDEGEKVRVRTAGAKVGKGKLRELLPIYQEQTVDKDLLVEGKRNLTQYLEAQGYFDAVVDFDLEKTGPDEQTITYSIVRGERHKLVHLEITGNQYFDDETLRERMYMTPATFLRYRHGRYSGDYLRRDVNAIKDLYRINGFRDVEVNSRLESGYGGSDTDIAVFLTVQEGPQWFVDSLEIRGASTDNLNYIQGVLQSSEGQPFSDFNVATDQENILAYYYNSGYPDATFDATVTPGPRPNTMTLRYVINEGERQYVRDVLTSGYNTTDPELVQSRIHNLEPGAPLSQAAITDNQRRLYDLGIFARVDTAVQNLAGETDFKNVLYRFEEARRYSLTFGFGAEIARIGRGSTTRGLSAQGNTGFSPRVSIGISRLNFLGQGHTVSLQTRVSRIQRRGLLSYLAPQFKGNERLNLSFTALYDDTRDVSTFNSRRQEVAAQLQQRFTKAFSTQYRLAWRRVTVSSVIIQPELIDLLSQPVKLGIASITFIQDRRDDPSDPRRGIWNTLDTGLASNIFGSKTSFARTVARNATYHRIGREVIFARATQIGVIGKISAAPIPLPERLFSGGGNSHRGFGESQAGPRDPFTGFPQGGQAVLVNNFELRFPLIGDNLRGVLFHDAGNVYSSFHNISLRFSQNKETRIDPARGYEYISDFDYMVHAVGFGIRYKTPVGPVRVDLGYPLNPPEFIGYRGTLEELRQGLGERTRQKLSRIQFHFSLGQVF